METHIYSCRKQYADLKMIIMLMLPEWDIRTHRISCHRNSFVDILSIVCHGHILHHHWLEQGCCTIFPFALCTYWYHSKYTLHKDPISPTFHQLRTMKTISHIQIHRFNIIWMNSRNQNYIMKLCTTWTQISVTINL